MFTGLIETQGRIARVTRTPGAARLAIRSPLPTAEMREGESVGVDGVCLTVSALRKDVFEADAIAETLQRSTLGRLAAGDTVHLERALALGDRLGGHLVQGHVDGVGRVISLTRRGGDIRLRVALPADLRRYVAEKGSIALSGVSLTVANVLPAGLEVALIPETIERTRLGALAPGDRVNVEVDLLARYLERLVGDRGPKPGRHRPRAGRT